MIFNFNNPPKIIVLIVSTIIVIILGLFDYITGYEISFSIFYLIPISIAVVLSNLTIGLFISLLSAVTWFFADIYSGHIYQNIAIPIWNAIMRLGYFVLHSFLLNKFLILYNQVKIDSIKDFLTGAYNSRFFYEILKKERNKSMRTKKPFTLVYIDVDDFKSVNDQFGHLAGDLLLRTISEVVQNNIRPTDVFARMGGDEFILLLSECDFNTSNTIINRIKENILKIKIHNWQVTVSMGAITYNSFTESVDDMIKN